MQEYVATLPTSWSLLYATVPAPFSRQASSDGRVYYYNTETEESSWDEPEELKRPIIPEPAQSYRAPASRGRRSPNWNWPQEDRFMP